MRGRAAIIDRDTVATVLLRTADARGQHPSLSFEPEPGSVQHRTWSTTGRRARACAAGLAGLGVRSGSRVGLHLTNRPDFYDVWWGAALLGAVVVPTNPLSTADELRYVHEHAECDVVITQDDLADTVRAAGRADTVTVGSGWVDDDDLWDGAVPSDPLAPLGVLYTSGTTSRPKGVVVSHAAYLNAGRVVAEHLRLRPDDRQLVVLPLFHGNAQYYSTMSALVTGASVALAPRFSASRWSEQAHLMGATVASLFAAPVRMILGQPPTRHDAAHALRLVMYAQNVTDSQVEQFESRFAVPLVQLYGMTETVAPPLMAPVFASRPRQSMGRPTLSAQVRLAAPDGTDVPLGEPGELLVGGDPGRTLMTQYLANPTATAAALDDGWLRTGDMARADADGNLYFVDRAKDVIKRAGENVACSEVERVMDEHPDVVESAAVGVPDAVRDEALVAYAVPREGSDLTEAALIAHVSRHLARFKVPDQVVLVQALPRTSVGKIQKHLLAPPVPAATPTR